jgi:hypothetical protein
LNIICLTCGEILKKEVVSMNIRHLKNKPVGPCTWHTFKCGLNNGIFLKIDECKILLVQIKFSNDLVIKQVTGCNISAPYLDNYGETDQDLL